MPEASRGTRNVRVWDCFLLNDEIELLRFRLGYLAEVVDVVVIVEAPWTHTGLPKPLHASEFLQAINADPDRIRHVIVDEALEADASASDRERAQHRGLRHGLQDVGPHDIVIAGDIDEIPWPQTVSSLNTVVNRPVRLVMEHAVLAANLKLPVPWTDGPKACRGSQIDHLEMGLLLGDPDARWSPTNSHIVERAGWHLSYLGGKNTVREKLASFQHTEFDTSFNRSNHHLDRCVRYGVDLRGRYLLQRLKPEELPSMLDQLRREWPAAFDFRSDQPLWERLLYRSYARVRQSRRFPDALARRADRSPRLLFLVAAAFVPLDLVASLGLRVRDYRRYRQSVVVT